jgi:DNA-binding transcriptional LysR family regulator
MEAASFDLLRAGNSVTNTLSGEVRVAITEGLGTFWLAPRLVDFQACFQHTPARWQQNNTSRDRVALAIRYLAVLSSR